MAWVYILHSAEHDKFYIGFTTESPELRLERHNSNYYEDKYTATFKPWELYWSLKCESNQQAQEIEGLIKKMKSKTYLKNLRLYPEMGEKEKPSTSGWFLLISACIDLVACKIITRQNLP